MGGSCWGQRKYNARDLGWLDGAARGQIQRRVPLTPFAIPPTTPG